MLRMCANVPSECVWEVSLTTSLYIMCHIIAFSNSLSISATFCAFQSMHRTSSGLVPLHSHHGHDYQHILPPQWQRDGFLDTQRAIKPRKTNLQWHQPKWQHQCSLKHFPWLCVAQMESPSQGRKSGLPAQLLAKACASSNFSLFGHFCAPEAAMPTFPGSKRTQLRPSKLQHNREGPSRGFTVHVAQEAFQLGDGRERRCWIWKNKQKKTPRASGLPLMRKVHTYPVKVEGRQLAGRNVTFNASHGREPHISPSSPRVGEAPLRAGDARTEQRRASELHHTTGGVHKHKASCSAHFKHTSRLSSAPVKTSKHQGLDLK